MFFFIFASHTKPANSALPIWRVRRECAFPIALGQRTRNSYIMAPFAVISCPTAAIERLIAAEEALEGHLFFTMLSAAFVMQELSSAPEAPVLAGSVVVVVVKNLLAVFVAAVVRLVARVAEVKLKQVLCVPQRLLVELLAVRIVHVLFFILDALLLHFNNGYALDLLRNVDPLLRSVSHAFVVRNFAALPVHVVALREVDLPVLGEALIRELEAALVRGMAAPHADGRAQRALVIAERALVQLRVADGAAKVLPFIAQAAACMAALANVHAGAFELPLALVVPADAAARVQPPAADGRVFPAEAANDVLSEQFVLFACEALVVRDGAAVGAEVFAACARCSIKPEAFKRFWPGFATFGVRGDVGCLPWLIKEAFVA